MSMPTYNKLVRDKIPHIIEASGKSYRTTILNETEYITELNTKLNEEINEYVEAMSSAAALEELADMLEVIYALAAVHGSSMEELEALRVRKADTRGGFQERVYLIDVED